MKDFAELFEAKSRYEWVMLLGNAEKSPEICGAWGEIKEKGTQTEEELQELLERVGERASCWGPICGIGDLFSFDFDWPFIYGLWHRHFGDRVQTLTYETPNMGARPFFLTTEKMESDPFESSLHTEFKGNHFVACGGHAHNVDGELRPYKLAQDMPIKRDDKIIQDSTRFLYDLLEGRYSWLQYKCIRERLSSKRIVLSHKQGLAVNSFMLIEGCEDFEIHNFRRTCHDVDEAGKHRIEYDRKITQTQIDSGRKYIEGGGLPFPCKPTETNEGLAAIFNFDEAGCRGCPRKRSMISLPSEPEEPVELDHITQIENPGYLNSPVIVEGIVSSTATAYAVPSRVMGEWVEGRGDDKREVSETVEIAPDSRINMEIAGATSKGKFYALSSLFPVFKGLRITDLDHRTVYRFRVRPPVFTLEKRGERIVDDLGYEYKSYGIYIVTDDKIAFPASSLVRLIGKPLPDPRNQKITLLVTATEFPEKVEGYDPEALKLLANVFDGKSVEERAEWIFVNFENYSRIVGRRNLAKAVLLGYFTPIWIVFNGELQKGWGNLLIVGDTTTGKSETVSKAIWLLKAGTLITAETASAVGLTGTATQVERGGWTVDWGFLVLNDRRLLTVDGAHKLKMGQWAALAESERSGVVTIAKAAKDSAYARTRQIKIANPIDIDSKRYMTKDLGSFLYPVQATSTFLDLMSVARIDMCVFADSHDVKAEEINRKQSGEYDNRLDLLAETLKWTWGENIEIVFTPEAEDKLLSESTELYNLFFCKSVPLASFDLKWKLARLSSSLACLTLSTVDFKRVIVEEDHVTWIVSFLKEEYTNAGLNTLAKESKYEVVTEEDAKHLLTMIAHAIKMEDGEETAKEIVKFIALQGRVTRDQLKEKFNLARKSQLVPLLSFLQNEKLVKVGRGFYPTKRLIETYRLLGQIGHIGGGKNETPPKQKMGQIKLEEGYIISDPSDLTNVTKNTADNPSEMDSSLQIQLQKVLGVIGEMERVSSVVQDEDLFFALLQDHGIVRSEAARLIGVLMRDGTIYSPRPGYYRRTV